MNMVKSALRDATRGHIIKSTWKMASSTSTVAWLSVMVKRSQTVVKERTILKK